MFLLLDQSQNFLGAVLCVVLGGDLRQNATLLLFYEVLQKGRLIYKILTFLVRIELFEHPLVVGSVFCHFACAPLFGLLTQKVEVLVCLLRLP